MIKLVLLRHGEGIWNKKIRFTGWTDIDLPEKGIKEARQFFTRSGEIRGQYPR